MLETIFARVICETFTHEVGNWQGGKESPQGMQLTFNLTDGEKVTMLIYGRDNYVGVYTKRLGEGWECMAFHDSCWRSDGVERFIFTNREKFSTLGKIWKRWFEIVPVGPELDAELKQVRKAKYG